MNNDYTKSPRLYVSNDLADKGIVPLSKEHAHYLLSVLRKTDGDLVRVFNGRHGEYVAQLCPLTKKSGELRDLKQIRPQPDSGHQIHLYFAPIKKDRLSFLIEKAVELGVTDLHPVITAHTENRKPNIEKIHSYIITGFCVDDQDDPGMGAPVADELVADVPAGDAAAASVSRVVLC